MRIVIPQLQIEIPEAPAGANLLAVLSQYQVPIARSCGGQGVCGTCRIIIEGEEIPSPTASELKIIEKQQLKNDERVACMMLLPESSKTWVLRSDYW